MEPMLNERETEYVNSLLKWDRLRMRLGWFLMILLMVGGTVFVVTAVLTLRKLDDQTIHTITLPGIVFSLSLIILSVLGIQWLKQRHLVASILTKLLHKPEHTKDTQTSPHQ